MTFLVLDKLTKRFGEQTAVDGISMGCACSDYSQQERRWRQKATEPDAGAMLVCRPPVSECGSGGVSITSSTNA